MELNLRSVVPAAVGDSTGFRGILSGGQGDSSRLHGKTFAIEYGSTSDAAFAIPVLPLLTSSAEWLAGGIRDRRLFAEIARNRI